jgi:hypothetical protein
VSPSSLSHRHHQDLNGAVNGFANGSAARNRRALSFSLPRPGKRLERRDGRVVTDEEVERLTEGFMFKMEEDGGGKEASVPPRPEMGDPARWY